MTKHDEVWSEIRARIEAEGGPVLPYEPSRPRTTRSWPRTGTVGAHATMDVDEHTAPLPDPIEHARHQLGVKPLPAVFPPGPGVMATVAQHVEAFQAGAQAAAAAAQGLAEAVREAAPPSRRGWLARWLGNPR